MSIIRTPNAKVPNYSGEPDDLLGIKRMLSLGRTLGAAGSCAPGMVAFFICPSPTPPGSCTGRITTTNGISEIEGSTAAFTASLYPNPYGETTVVHIDVSEYTEFNISVYDILGRVVRQINVAGSSSFDVPLSGFNQSAGIYLIAVSDSHNTVVLKMIKL